MPAGLTWRKLLPGLGAIVAVGIVALSVLLFAGVGQIRGEKEHFYLATDQARGVMKGTEVWIAGQKAGLVDRVSFAPPSSDTVGRVVIAFSVRESDAAQIRRTSTAELRAGTSIIAPVVISIDAGTPGSPAAHPGDTIRATRQADFETATAKLGAATKELPQLMADVKTIATLAREHPLLTMLRGHDGDGEGTGIIGLRERFAGFQKSRASAARATFSARAQATLARADSVRALLASSTGTLGRMRRDSRFAETVASVSRQLDTLRAEMTSTDGTLGRYARDSALSHSVIQSQKEMQLLFNDIRRRPLHYIWF
jgi:ABC-type transporter Mla subunit MlaD